MAFINRLKNLGNRIFTRHLLLANTTVCIVFMGAGDSIQQTLEKRFYPKQKNDPKRTMNMMTVGVGFGVLAHFWYKMLDSRFPGKKASTIFKKLLAEGAMGPPFILGFFLSMGYLENKPIQKSYDDFKKNILVICMADWAVYLPLQALNFYFLPPRFRVLYVCSLTLVYDVFLSYILHKDDIKKAVEIKEL